MFVKPRRSPLATVLFTTLSLAITLIVAAAIYFALRYGRSDLSAADFTVFSPPDGRCTVTLPGAPTVEETPAEGFAVLDGKRFTVNRWFERARVSFGWIDLDASELEGASFDQIADPFRDREVKRLHAQIEGESLVDYVAGHRRFQARRTRLDTPYGRAILQVYVDLDRGRLRRHDVVETVQANLFEQEPAALLITGMWMPVRLDVKTTRRALDPNQHIRLYFALAQGKRAYADSPWVQKFFNSFTPE